MANKFENSDNIKSIINICFFCVVISIATYFSLMIFEPNEKLNIIFYSVFAIVFFLVSDIFLFPQKRIIDNITNFLMYIIILILTYMPVLIIYSMYKHSSGFLVFSEVSTTISTISSYMIVKYTSSVFRKEILVEPGLSKVSLVENSEVDICSKVYNFDNLSCISKSDNLFINNDDLYAVIEQNALMQQFDKNNIDIIPNSLIKKFNQISQKAKSESFDSVMILDLRGNKIFSENDKNSDFSSVVFNSFFQYLAQFFSLNSIEDIKDINIYSNDYKYEIKKEAEYFIVKGKSEKFSKNSKKRNKKINTVISELLEAIMPTKLECVELVTSCESMILM